MAIIVQKYGGSSVADVARIQKVAERVAATRAGGDAVVVVVSAMGETTDELTALANQVCENPQRRELDMLLTAGERISMALLSMALNAKGIPAVSFTGSQSGIITDGSHTHAKIVEVRPFRVQEELDRGRVVIVAGYQGVSREKEVTTLARGGSDTTAVALAAALDAAACEIYSDVDGVHTADPRVVEASRRIPSLSYEEMQELALAGAQVLNVDAVEFAKERGIVIHSRRAEGGGGETRIRAPQPDERRPFTGVASKGGLALLHAEGATQGLLRRLASLDGLGGWDEGLTLDGAGRFSWVLPGEGARQSALQALLAAEPHLRLEEGLGLVSLVGAGLRDEQATLPRFLMTISSAGEAPLLFSASRLRFSALVQERQLAPLARALHREFIEGCAS